MRRKIGFAVIGVGRWGEVHAKIYASHPCSKLVAVVDLNREKAKEVARRYKARRYFTDYQSVLKDEEIEAVSIATPDFAHKEPTVAAAEAGKHILLEKPLATTLEDTESIVKAVKKNKVKIMVDFHNRWNPPFVIARETIAGGKLGRLISAYFRLNDTIFVPTKMLPWAAKSSILWFLGSHVIDTLRWILSDEVDRVYSVSRSEVLIERGISTPDIFQTILEFKKGVIASIENNWIVPNTHPNVNDFKFNILGSKGMISMDLSNNQAIERYFQDGSDHPDFLVKPTIYGKPMGFAHESIRYFVESITKKKELFPNLEDGVNNTKVILAIMKSTRKRKPIKVIY